MFVLNLEAYWSSFLAVVSTAVVYLNVIVSTVFIGLFLREPWTKTPFGRAIMALAGSILVFSILGLLVTVLGTDYPLREEARALGRLAITAAMTTVTVVLIRARRGPR